MIDYYEELGAEEQRKVTDAIRKLYRQTFLLERRYDRKTGRYQVNGDYYPCSKHLEFVRAYFAIMDIQVVENSQMGVIYIQGEQVMGEKLSRLATFYILALKLIYDEQMSAVSTSVNAVTSLGEIHEKLGTYRLLLKQPSVTEIRRTLALLKRYGIHHSIFQKVRDERHYANHPVIAYWFAKDISSGRIRFLRFLGQPFSKV